MWKIEYQFFYYSSKNSFSSSWTSKFESSCSLSIKFSTTSFSLSLPFNLLSISVTIDKGFEIKDNVYIFEGNTGICYYNFENDVFKRLINNTKISINEIQVEDNLVYIYCDDNIKYELNLDTIILKAVAYWE